MSSPTLSAPIETIIFFSKILTKNWIKQENVCAFNTENNNSIVRNLWHAC